MCAFSSSLTTTVFSQRSMRWFDATPRRATPKGHQSFISHAAAHRLRSPTYIPTSLSARVAHTRVGLRRDQDPPDEPASDPPVPDPGPGKTGDLGIADHPLRDTSVHHRSGRRTRRRPRQVLLREHDQHHPPPGPEPGGDFPPHHLTPRSAKPSSISTNRSYRNAASDPVLEWSAESPSATPTSNTPTTRSSNTTPRRRYMSSTGPLRNLTALALTPPRRCV